MSDTTPVTDLPPDANTPAPEGQAETPPPNAGQPPAKWEMARVTTLTRQRHEAERKAAAEAERAEAAERALADLRRQQAGQPAPQPPAETREQVEARVRADVEQRAALVRFDERCNTLAESIKATMGETALQEASAGLREVGLDFDQAAHREFAEDVISLENGAAVFHYLGTHRQEAHDILEMGPRAQARALAAVAAKVGNPAAGNELAAAAPPAARAVSAAPPPPGRVPPPNRGSSRSVYDPNLSMADFVAMREKRG